MKFGKNERSRNAAPEDVSVAQNPLLRNRTGSVVKINKDFLMATLFGWLTWRLWNWDTDFYGAALLAIMFGIVAFGSVLGAVIQIGKLYEREKAIAAYVSQGVKPKTSELAGGDALDKAGMR